MNKTYGPHSLLVRFLWKRIPFDELGLPSTLIHWVFKKTHQFENAIESGSKRKCIHNVLVWTVSWTVENASK